MKDNLLREFCILAYPLYTAHNFTCFDCKKITTQEDIVKNLFRPLRVAFNKETNRVVPVCYDCYDKRIKLDYQEYCKIEGIEID